MFKSKLVPHLIIISIVFILSSCSEQTNPDFEEGKYIIPLNTGNSWNYLITYFDSLGAITETKYETAKIFKDTLLDGRQWYSYSNEQDGIWFTNKSDGYWVFIQGTSFFSDSHKDTSILIFKYPTYNGDTYSNYQVLSLNDEVTVPAGKYKCIHIVADRLNPTNNLKEKSDTYFVPDMGIVMIMEQSIKASGEKTIFFKKELNYYSLK